MSRVGDKLAALGTVAYLPLNGDLLDAIGTHDGATVSSAGAALGSPGLGIDDTQSLGLDGASWLNLPDATDIRPGAAWSWGQMVKVVYPASGQVYIGRKESGGPWLVVNSAGQLALSILDSGVRSAISANGVVANGGVHFIGCEYDGTRIRILVDGTQVASTTITLGATFAVGTWGIGGRSGTQDLPPLPNGSRISEWFWANSAIGDANWADLNTTLTLPAPAPRVAYSRQMVRVASSAAPDTTNLARTAARFKWVFLQPWKTAIRDALKAANPNIKVLAYQNLGAFNTLRDSATAISASAVNYDETTGHDDWFLHSIATGLPFTFSGFNFLYGAHVGNAGYRAKVATNLGAFLDAHPGWDGIFADDVNPTIKYHHPANDVVELANDTAYQAASTGMLQAVWPTLQSRSKLLIPNLGAWQEYPNWAKGALAYCDGGFDETRGKFNASSADESTYEFWSAAWWRQQDAQAYCEFVGKTYLSGTLSTAGDARAARYGYATTMLLTEGRTGWGPQHDYNTEEWQDFLDVDLGAPFDPPVAPATDVKVYLRRFERGMVAVNPTDTDGLTVAVPKFLQAFGGTVASGVLTLDSHEAFIGTWGPRISLGHRLLGH